MPMLGFPLQYQNSLQAVPPQPATIGKKLYDLKISAMFVSSVQGNMGKQRHVQTGMREGYHRGCARQSILHLYPLPRHCPVQLPLHLQQVLIHPRVLCKFGVLKNDIGDGFVEKFSSPIDEIGSKNKELENVQD